MGIIVKNLLSLRFPSMLSVLRRINNVRCFRLYSSRQVSKIPTVNVDESAKDARADVEQD